MLKPPKKASLPPSHVPLNNIPLNNNNDNDIQWLPEQPKEKRRVTRASLPPTTIFGKAKCLEQDLMRYRVEKRIDHMINIVNLHLIKHGIISDSTCLFSMNNVEKNKIMTGLCDHISKYKGNRETQIKIRDGGLKECHCLVRTWWNRQKAYKLGNILFEPMMKMIFRYLALCNSKLINKTETQRIVIFIDIFHQILLEKIKYNERTMPRPLIPIQIFNKSNKFKSFCQIFLYHFSMRIDHNHGSLKWIGFKPYAMVASGPQKSQILADSYMESLKLLRSKYLLKSIFKDESNTNNTKHAMYQWINTLSYNSFSKQEKLASVPKENGMRFRKISEHSKRREKNQRASIVRPHKYMSSSNQGPPIDNKYHGAHPLIIPKPTIRDRNGTGPHRSGPRSDYKFRIAVEVTIKDWC